MIAITIKNKQLNEEQNQTFKTSKGSIYQFFPDGTTIRNKSDHSDVGHDKSDQGVKQKSELTVYVEPESTKFINPVGFSGRWRMLIKDQQILLITWNEVAGRWGKSPTGGPYKFSFDPQIGLSPVELWKKGPEINGWNAYHSVHCGNPIVDISKQELQEINMSPTFLRQQGETINAKVGIEFELCCKIPQNEVGVIWFKNRIVANNDDLWNELQEIDYQNIELDLLPKFSAAFKKFRSDSSVKTPITLKFFFEKFLSVLYPELAKNFKPITGRDFREPDRIVQQIISNFPFKANYFPGARTKATIDLRGKEWIAEDDASIEPDVFDEEIGIEFVSPILGLREAKDSVLSVKKWCEKFGHYTNESTGLHINVSINKKTDQNPFGDEEIFSESVDFVKLALLLGDKYILEVFDRAKNTFAKSSLDKIHNLVKSDKTNQNALLQAIYEIKNSLQETAMYTLNNKFATSEKYVSIHLHENRVEFRSPGGDWLPDVEKVLSTIDRFVVVLDAATDPEKYKKEYIKKLWKLIDQYSNVQSPKNTRSIDKIDYKNLYADRSASDVAAKVLKGKQQKADSNAQKVLRSLSSLDYERPEPLEENLNDFFLAGDEELIELEEESNKNLDPYVLASKSPIRILRDKEFYIGHVHRTNLELASALFTGNDEGVFSFDIVVDPTYSKDGLGKDLIKIGLQEFRNLKADGFVETILLDCVNPIMKKMLEKFGLIVKDQIDENRWIMGLPDPI